MLSTFIIYDIVFLVLFVVGGSVFLYKNRRNLKRQGILYLYPTQIGVKFIDRFTKKYGKILRPLQYLIVISGYLLMIGMLWLLARFSYFYVTSPYAAKALKVPVLTPLIPYLPELFKLDFLPHFYFTYWIIIIAIIAIPHEFAHGIFARLNNIRVHSTGFGFLGPFLAAFVEPDEKQMEKAKIFPQLSILAAGTFANVLMTILFGILMALFFLGTFTPAGVYFNTYASAEIPLNAIISVNGTTLANYHSLSDGAIDIHTSNKTYFVPGSLIKQTIDTNRTSLVAFEDSPAYRAKLQGAITSFDKKQVSSYDSLTSAIRSHHPGDTVAVTTVDAQENIHDYTITLQDREGKAFLGIGFIPYEQSGLIGKVTAWITRLKDPTIYYKSTLGSFGVFVYDLLWWIFIINISVALVNMLPAGIFDGGRFFYLTILGITRSKKVAGVAFKISTWIMLALVVVLMAKWVFVFI
ncbi:site-2 protease family protein [Candidatus Pacearchaeota archaeon]|nr:site-2 protease family protein [Candidatus Pacearchaeota archaeon]